MTIFELPISLVALVAAAVLSGAIILAIRPLLLRYALARPNARSSHRVPTPQGAGIAVIAATLLVACAVMICTGAAELKIPVAVFGAALFIAVVGNADDIKSIAVPRRLLLQAAALAAIVFTAPGDLRIVAA
jgi:UDP-N-acetylmuramyl pentapeptide phosphotransferase/UDP-N-acetylglucosamine-1-phosphate transferase